MNTLAELFNPHGREQAQTNTDIYKVSYKDGKNKVYRSVVRFVPYFKSPLDSIKYKRVSYVKNPITNRGMYIDDPKTVNEFSPVTDMFFKFKNTNISSYVEYARQCLSSKEQYAALVQIMQDEQHPELQGKIKIFIFGKKVYEKIINEEFPPAGYGLCPYNPITGRRFQIICTQQGDFNDFTQSSFVDIRDEQGNVTPSAMWYINPETNQYEVVTENTNQQDVLDYLEKNSPDLSKYEYNGNLTDEQKNFVNDVLTISQEYLNTGKLSMPTSGVPSQPMQQGPAMPSVQVTPPVFPGAVQQPVVHQQNGFSSNAASGGLTFGGQTQSVQPQPVVVGVQTPNVAPHVAPQQPVGINVDDILKNI